MVNLLYLSFLLLLILGFSSCTLERKHPPNTERAHLKAPDYIYSIKIISDVKASMQDGVKLSADLYLPESPEKFPAILVRTPYGKKSRDLVEMAIFFAQRGYGVVIQDVRGKYSSEGSFYPFLKEAEDGYESLKWVAEQPWCNGKVGTAGVSYSAIAQWLLSSSVGHYLKAMIPIFSPSSYLEDGIYQNKVFRFSLAILWATKVSGKKNQNLKYYHWPELFFRLPLISLPERMNRKILYFKDWIKHSFKDSYSDKFSMEGKYGEIDVPVYHVGGWYDVFAEGTLRNYMGMMKYGKTVETRKSQKLLMGPWDHGSLSLSRIGEIDFSPAAILDLYELQLKWFDFWLKGLDTGIMEEPPIRIFVMGRNLWRYEKEWPLARTLFTNYYFHSNGSANSLRGNGKLSLEPPSVESPDTYLYDPKDPVLTLGGNNCCWSSIVPMGPYDQRPVETREDVLVYSSEPLKEDLEMTGPLMVKLYASSDAADTDFTAKLVDVHPDGYAQNLADGILRARWLESAGRAVFLQPGRIYKFPIYLGSTSHLFKKGHRIRVEISSSNFPRFDRNLNTGYELGIDDRMQTATQTIYHNSIHPSHIVFPIIP